MCTCLFAISLGLGDHQSGSVVKLRHLADQFRCKGGYNNGYGHGVSPPNFSSMSVETFKFDHDSKKKVSSVMTRPALSDNGRHKQLSQVYRDRHDHHHGKLLRRVTL
jgi:hypothetical protein